MKTRALLTVIAVAEILTGCGLLALPSTAVELLIGQPLGDGAAMLVGRVAGAAMISLGLICWLERGAGRQTPPSSLLKGLLFYNCAVPVVLLHGYLAHGMNGVGLWAATAVHSTLAAWLAACLFAGSAVRTH